MCSVCWHAKENLGLLNTPKRQSPLFFGIWTVREGLIALASPPSAGGAWGVGGGGGLDGTIKPALAARNFKGDSALRGRGGWVETLS